MCPCDGAQRNRRDVSAHIYRTLICVCTLPYTSSEARQRRAPLQFDWSTTRGSSMCTHIRMTHSDGKKKPFRTHEPNATVSMGLHVCVCVCGIHPTRVATYMRLARCYTFVTVPCDVVFNVDIVHTNTCGARDYLLCKVHFNGK